MPPDGSTGGNIVGSIFILIVLILINAFFAMSEIAILSVNENKIKKLAENGNKKAAILAKVTASPSSFLATIQVGVTLSGLLASAVAAEKFADMLVDALSFLPINLDVLGAVVLVCITLILSYFTLIFGELVPKRFAMRYSEKISLGVARIIWVFYKIAKPFVALLAASTNGVLKLFGIKNEEEEQSVTEEDILLMVDAGAENGAIEGSEKNMIRNIIEFEDRDVSEVMTHRVDMAAADVDDSADEVLNLAQEGGYSRIPVYQGSPDEVVGVIYIKDLLPLVRSGAREIQLKDYMREPLYVPESMPCKKLLMEFQEKKIHIAIVIDEYGGTAGLVTLEDLLETIVGNIQDEFDSEEEEIEKISEDTFDFDGGVPLEEVEETLGGPIFGELECDTIGGYVLEMLGRLPESGEEIALPISDRYLLTVLGVEERKIAKVRIQRIQPVPAELTTNSR